jgi:glutaredoxin
MNPPIPEPISLTFYTKPDCPLCDQAEKLLEIVGDRWPLRVARVNIVSDRDAYEQYHDRIPVLLFAGGVVLIAPISRDDLTGALKALSGPVA